MSDHSSDEPTLTLIHRGWDHLKSERPLAAWACWSRALRDEPGHEAATRALHSLANARDLPEAARLEYKFLTPDGPERRGRWDSTFRGRNMGELDVAASAFAELAEADPNDAHARFNESLCLAWMGRNPEAIASLDRAVSALAKSEPHVAAEAWTLAEVLRQGGGAEHLADEVGHVVTIAWTPGEADPSAILDVRADLLPMPSPIDAATGQPRPGLFFEWVDRVPLAADPPEASTIANAARVRAHVLRLPGSLRLHGYEPLALEELVEEISIGVGDRVARVDRESRPLPLSLADQGLWWSTRLPSGLDEETQGRIHREAVERYYEGAWLRRPRKALDGRTPLEEARLAGEGDPVAVAKLSGVVRFREQLGERPGRARLYQGYPFDRLRRRLGLSPVDPDAIDPAEAGSMGPAELDRLDPGSLDDLALIDAFESAAALGEDGRTARFAGALAGRDPSALRRVDLRAVFAVLVRSELAAGSVEGALRRVDRAVEIDRAIAGGRDTPTYETWRAEIYVRAERPDDALGVYQDLSRRFADPARALDAAEMLFDAGYPEQARTMGRIARDLASGDGPIAEGAARLLTLAGEDI